MDRWAIVVSVSRPGVVDRLSWQVSLRAPAGVHGRASHLRRRHRASGGARRLRGVRGHLRALDWVVYAKRPFAGPEPVLAYLGRYTHRVALSNDRLVEHRDGHVRFRWKDYADHDRVKILTLEVDEFIRRFLLHIVPSRFVRIRHFGLLANRTRHGHVARARQLLGAPSVEPVHPESVLVLLQRLTGVDVLRCPFCADGRMYRTAVLAPTRLPPPDTS